MIAKHLAQCLEANNGHLPPTSSPLLSPASPSPVTEQREVQSPPGADGSLKRQGMPENGSEFWKVMPGGFWKEDVFWAGG